MSLLSPPLQAFMAVVRHKTVHGAAADIHLTQTAVTQRIRALERQLHTTLFIRTRRGMQLTQEGEALFRYCQASKELEGEALAIIQGAGQTAEIEITISAPTSIMHSRVIPQSLATMKTYPNLLMHFKVDDIASHALNLRSGQADIAIIREEEIAQEMKFKKLIPEQYVLVACKAWQHRTLKDIIQQERIIDFTPNDPVTFNYLKKYHLFNFAKHHRHFVNRTDNLALLVAAGIGYTTLALEFAKPYLDSGQLIILNQGKTLNLIPVLAWFDRPEPADYFSALLKAIN